MIREIYPNRLFIGNAMDARDLQLLHVHQIAAVVDLAANEPPAQLARDMIYCRIPIVDGSGNSNASIESAIQFVVTLIGKEFRTLLACSAGMSRSPAIAAVTLALITKQLPNDCLTEVFAGTPHDVSPALWSDVQVVYDGIVGN